MSGKWVMAERKFINGEWLSPGDPAPAGHEGRAYTCESDRCVKIAVPNPPESVAPSMSANRPEEGHLPKHGKKSRRIVR